MGSVFSAGAGGENMDDDNIGRGDFGRDLDLDGTSWRDDFMEDAMERATEGYEINGLFFRRKISSVVIIPEEMMEKILSYSASGDVLNIASVCIRWKTITSSRSFWKLFCARHNIYLDKISPFVKDGSSAWIAYYSFCKHNILRKNFVKNHSGEDHYPKVVMINGLSSPLSEQFAAWHLDPPTMHGGSFRIEETPIGCDNLPDDPEFPSSSCFVTSYTLANKHQRIDLWKAGLTPAVMKLCAPFEFDFSEMIGVRFDCGVQGTVRIVLMPDGDEQTPGTQIEHNQINFNIPAGTDWQKIRLRIVVDPAMMEATVPRYLILTEAGKDSQFWAGYYGPKFARACVKFKCLDLDTNTVATPWLK